jgi:hypothetical protein
MFLLKKFGDGKAGIVTGSAKGAKEGTDIHKLLGDHHLLLRRRYRSYKASG